MLAAVGAAMTLDWTGPAMVWSQGREQSLRETSCETSDLRRGREHACEGRSGSEGLALPKKCWASARVCISNEKLLDSEVNSRALQGIQWSSFVHFFSLLLIMGELWGGNSTKNEWLCDFRVGRVL